MSETLLGATKDLRLILPILLLPSTAVASAPHETTTLVQRPRRAGSVNQLERAFVFLVVVRVHVLLISTISRSILICSKISKKAQINQIINR